MLILALSMVAFLRQGPAHATDRPPVLYLVDWEAHAPAYVVPTTRTTCSEPNLVVVTHGWYERQSWPGWMARAMAQKVDRRAWRCAWYDWRPRAKRWRPSNAATIGRDIVGPQLGREIVRLSPNWRHVHLVGHSAGSWVVNAAAEIIAADTKAEIHITFLDAYIPEGWDEKDLARLARQPYARCWAEHYFTRDPLNFTENILTHAHNVDITALNPGFKSHKFPWHWYHATIVGRYTTDERFRREPIVWKVGEVTYGFSRARENGRKSWEESLALELGNKPIRIPRPGN